MQKFKSMNEYFSQVKVSITVINQLESVLSSFTHKKSKFTVWSQNSNVHLKTYMSGTLIGWINGCRLIMPDSEPGNLLHLCLKAMLTHAAQFYFWEITFWECTQITSSFFFFFYPFCCCFGVCLHSTCMQEEEQRAIKATAEYGQMKMSQHNSLLLSNVELSEKKNVCVACVY